MMQRSINVELKQICDRDYEVRLLKNLWNSLKKLYIHKVSVNFSANCVTSTEKGNFTV